MSQPGAGGEAPISPIFIVADDNRDAVGALLFRLPSIWFYVPVYDPGQVLQYAKSFNTTAVLLADPLPYPRGGSKLLLQRLLDEVGKPVIVMAEDWNPEVAAAWRRMGAHDCIPHPTRVATRVEALRSALQKLAFAPASRDRIAYFSPTG